MATAELAPASLEPHYAPDDPSLPNPWKGLIDGGTGFLYYWNPETNVTQYERPTALHTDFLQGPPATASPNLASSSIIGQPQQYGMVQQQVQQMPQLLGQQYLKQEGLPMLQQQAQQMPQKQQVQQQQMGNHVTPQQHGNQWPNPCQGLQLLDQNQGQQVPQQKGHQMLQHLGQQFSPQLQKIPYPQGQQISHLQGQQIPQQQGNQFGFSSSQVQNSRFTSINNIPAGTHPVHTPHTNFQPVHTQQSTSSSIDPPLTGGSLVQAQQSGMDAIHQKQVSDPMFQNKTGPPLSSYQQSGGPTIGLKLGFDDKHGRAGNEIQFTGNREKTMIIQHQPKLGAIPLAHNQQEMRMGSFHPQNVTADHTSVLNISVGHLMPNVYNHSTSGQAFPNNAPGKPSPRVLGTSDPSNAPMEPSPRILGASDLTNLSSADIYCRQHDVTALGDDVPPPFMTFEATGFPSEILRELKSAGFSSPTPIQAQTWPIALQSRDIVAIARTGSGKTLGYLLPAFLHLRRCQNNSQAGPTVVVMAPTRELATQIQDEAIKFGRSSRFSCTCLYGGAPKGPQLREIERGADIIVATPGRLNDILEMKKISFDQVSFLVLDEADRMLNMGFEPQIRKIVNEIPPRRQTLMYTATWPKEVRKIAGDLLVKPVQVNIGNIDELEANKAITQYVEVVPQMEKQRRLEQILRSQEPGAKVIIFCSTKRSCDQLARSIGRSFGAAAIHGDKAQGERDRVLNQFRSGKSPILVATDVAARGLDIKDIRSVVNYDFPTGVEDYVHRIGRTGRAGATGVSYTFFTDQDRKHAADLVKVLEGANQQVPPEIREMAARGGSGFSRGRGGVQRWDSGGGRWENGGRSGRDNGFSRGGRDSGFSRGGRDISRGGRADFFGSRGNRGRGGFGGSGSRGRSDQGRRDRYDSMDSRDRYNNPRGLRERNRGRSHSRSYSPSPDRVRTRDYNRSRSRSRSRSWTRSRSRSRSHSYDKYERPDGREVVLNPPSGSGGPPPSQISDGINSATDSSKQLVAEM